MNFNFHPHPVDFVVGKNVEIGDCDNSNAWTINGKKAELRRKGDDHLYKDDTKEFVDLDS